MTSLNRALFLMKSRDTYAAIEHLIEEGDPLAVIKNFSELVRLLYWQEKDLAGVVAMGRAGIQYGLSYTDPEVRKVAKAIAYNLASFTWNGWDEVGIKITEGDLAVGLDSAQACVRLAKELEQDDIARSRSRFMLGAHYLSSGNVDKAKYNFYRATVYANRADNQAEALLAWAFIYITKRDYEELAGIKARLQALEGNVKGLLGQIETAERVFNRPLPASEVPE